MIGVIGGTGVMGQLLATLFDKHNINYCIISRKSKDYKQLIAKSDILLLSIPMDTLPAQVEILSHYDLTGKLIVDMSSAMQRAKESLAKLTCEIAYVHLLFGPQVTDFKEQNIITAGETAKIQDLLTVFKKEGCVITKSTPQIHDQMMQHSQVLWQNMLLLAAKQLSESQISREELRPYLTNNAQHLVNGLDSIFAQDAHLWQQIQASQQAQETRINILKNTKELDKQLLKETFADEFAQWHDSYTKLL
jgi:prephenate dehydrogenase